MLYESTDDSFSAFLAILRNVVDKYCGGSCGSFGEHETNVTKSDVLGLTARDALAANGRMWCLCGAFLVSVVLCGNPPPFLPAPVS